MRTEELITALAADNARQRPSPDLALSFAALAAVAVAAALLFASLGVRPDFAAALETLRFPFKFVVTLSLAGAALVLVRRNIFPDAGGTTDWVLLLLSPLLLGLGVLAELLALPTDAWAMAAQGKNGLLCLTVIPLLGIAPLGLLLWALRRGAPTHPVFAGFCAGLVAGGISATFYAAYCTDDSPLFVATWYPIGIAVVAVAGALLGHRLARW